MSASRLKKIMQAEDKRVIDIASELKISPHTVMKYLRGERINRAIQAAIEGFLARKDLENQAAG
jgi:hypothetical protein